MKISSVDLEKLNSGTAGERLSGLGRYISLCEGVQAGKLANDHIHTFYSFSKYSPTAAALLARLCGFSSAGIADHDSVSGAGEFISAGKLIGISTIVGCECRAIMRKTALSGYRLNSPDQTSLAYVVMHGIPEKNLDIVDEFFAPRRRLRFERDAAMCEKLSKLTKPLGFGVDFEADVLPLSHAHEGGSVTERHIVFALAKKLLLTVENDAELRGLLSRLGIFTDEKLYGENDAEYRLLSLLKSGFVEKFYIPAGAECPDVSEFVEFCGAVGAVPAYAYLGDVAGNYASDKKAQRYEDGCLDILMPELKRLGFGVVTYMPCRNTKAQVEKIKTLCDKYGFLAVTGGESPLAGKACEQV